MKPGNRQKKLKKLKKGGSLTGFLLFLIGYPLFLVMIVLFVTFLVSQAIESRLTSEYASIYRMGALYEQASSIGMDPAQISDMLNAENRDYFVRDASGKTLYTQGRITLSDDAVPTVLPLYGAEAVVFPDSESSYLTITEESINVDLVSILEDLRANKIFIGSIDIDEESGDEITGDEITVIDSDEKVIELPIWMKLPLSDGGSLTAKAAVSAAYDDVLFLIVATCVIVFFVLLLFVILLVSVIRSLHRQKVLRNIYFEDDATGGKNWTYYVLYGESALKRWRNRAKAYAVVDLAMLKYRNYCVSHSVKEGENLLCNIMALLQRNTDKGEIYVHIGGGEFALLLAFTDEAALRDRLRELLRELKHVEDGHVFHFHMGADLIDIEKRKDRPVCRKEVDLESSFANAATARETLFGSEDSGLAIFDEKMKAEQTWMNHVQESQQKALDNEEFVVYYQPKYTPDTGVLRGAEALIRWASPEYGFVSPGRFIPIFEKNGFITKIDHYMIRHVARDQKAWLDAGYKCVPVSVNVSRAHFIEEDLAEQIRDMVDEAGAPHELIEIELTESAFFDDKNALVRIIDKLKSYGFSVSMDDFGAGYSSLNSLKDMALDVLKLDAEFFRGDADNARKEIVVSEAIHLAKSLDMRIVAEGVEDKEQVDFLAGQGCDLIQGYYFARPMPKVDYEERMGKA